MADPNASSNTAIVAIVVVVLLAIGLFYYFNYFGHKEGTNTTIERPQINIEQPRNNRS